MKEAVLAIIGSTLIDEKQLSSIKKLFRIMDTGGDGKLGPAEIK